MTMFHSDDYINFLRMVTDPSNSSVNYSKQMYKCKDNISCNSVISIYLFQFPHNLVNVGEDCPVFDGLYQFCQISAGGSVGMKNND